MSLKLRGYLSALICVVCIAFIAHRWYRASNRFHVPGRRHAGVYQSQRLQGIRLRKPASGVERLADACDFTRSEGRHKTSRTKTLTRS